MRIPVTGKAIDESDLTAELTDELSNTADPGPVVIDREGKVWGPNDVVGKLKVTCLTTQAAEKLIKEARSFGYKIDWQPRGK